MKNLKYLHCIDLNDKIKCLNICSNRILPSLLSLQLFLDDSCPNPMTIDIEKLRNYELDDIKGISSPRMYYIYKRSLLSKSGNILTDAEKRIIEIGNLEIELERARREYNFSAPSRLSSLYLVEDNLEGRITLRNMFNNIFHQPIILEVQLGNCLEIMKFDYNWIELFINNPQEEYLKNYWESKISNNGVAMWEYLLEGTITITNQFQFEEIIEYTRKNYLSDYQEIIKQRSKFDC
jgi:hypothetical protein